MTFSFSALRKGFTLVELLVVIAIIGMLSTLAVVSLGSARTKARDAKRLADIRQVQSALELFYSDKNAYPTATSLVLGSTNGVRLDGGTAAGFAAASSTGTPVYMGRVPADPSATLSYTYNATGGGTGYTITFTIESAVQGLSTGVHTATQEGIF